MPNGMTCHLYVLQNQRGKRYVGVTANLDRRLAEHNRGQSRSTRGRGPWHLVYTEKFSTPQEAKRREREIKMKKRRSFIENPITDGRVV